MSEIKLILVETKMLPKAVHMRFADNPDAAKAEYWIDFQVPLEGLKLPSQSGERPLGEIEKRYVRSVRLAAIRYARELLSEESQDLAGRLPSG